MGIIGYCYCITHMAYLPTVLFHQHQCPFLKRNDEASFWRGYYLKKETQNIRQHIFGQYKTDSNRVCKGYENVKNMGLEFYG